MYNLTQKLTAEFLGTFALIFFGAGAVCVDWQLRSTGGLGLLAIALAHGLAIAIMVSALGHISGGHFNPAITIGFWVTKRISTLDTLAYWGAQLLGAIAAAFLLKVVIPDEIWRNVALGTPELMRDFPTWGALALEGGDDVLPGAGGVCDGGGRTRSVPRDRRIWHRSDDSRWGFWLRDRSRAGH